MMRKLSLAGLMVGLMASSSWALIPGQTGALPQSGPWSGTNWSWETVGVYKWNSWFGGSWWLGSAVAIGPNHIITANHNGHQPTDYLQINGVQYHALESFTVPASLNLGTPDIKVIKVDGTLPVYNRIFSGELPKNTPVTLIGYGQTGIIADGNATEQYQGDPGHAIYSPQGIGRWGTNLLSQTAGQSFRIGLSDAMTDFEAMPGNGDSGGGMFVKVGDQWMLAGTITVRNGGVALPVYSAWINSVTGVPEPAAATSLLAGALLLLRPGRLLPAPK